MFWKLLYILGNLIAFLHLYFIIYLIAFFVAVGYFIFNKQGVKNSVAFFKKVFPDKGALFYYRCAFLQFLNRDYSKTTWESDGWEYLEKAISEKTGGILLMSHIGNWDAASYLFYRESTNLMLLIGTRNSEEMEKYYKKKFKNSNIKIITTEPGNQSPANIIEPVNFLKEGGFVAVTGDRIWHSSQRFIEAQFMNETIHVPEFPFMLSMLSKKPVYIFFITGKKRDHYYLRGVKPLMLSSDKRENRTEVLHSAVQLYSEELEKFARHYPFSWFHFEDFFKRNE
jgi:predicted LPLAT superfamily acyltransferase